MRRLVVVLVTACSSHPPVAAPCPAPPVAAKSLDAAPSLDDAAVKERSHAFFDAFDRDDLAKLEDQLAPSFVWFEFGRFYDRSALPGRLRQRVERHAPIHSRTWKDERVYIGPTSAVFYGDAVEHVPADGEAKPYDQEGWNTLVWVRDGGTWRIAQWQWEIGGIEAERLVWNDRFRHGGFFKLTANQLLIDTVRGRRPGSALDLLMGQGRNALYLAKQGWRVTGVDISDEGIRVAKEAAAKDKLKLDTIQTDIDTWDLGKDKWDLVTMIYAGDDDKLVERAKAAVKKGGLFVLEYFHAESDAKKAGAGGWATGALAAHFKNGWKIVRDDVVEDVADWSLRKQKLVRFVAEKQ